MPSPVPAFALEALQPGARVTWHYVPRGGWGYVLPVPATVVRVTATRVVIDADLLRGGTKRVSVRPENLSPVEPRSEASKA